MLVPHPSWGPGHHGVRICRDQHLCGNGVRIDRWLSPGMDRTHRAGTTPRTRCRPLVGNGAGGETAGAGCRDLLVCCVTPGPP